MSEEEMDDGPKRWWKRLPARWREKLAEVTITELWKWLIGALVLAAGSSLAYLLPRADVAQRWFVEWWSGTIEIRVPSYLLLVAGSTTAAAIVAIRVHRWILRSRETPEEPGSEEAHAIDPLEIIDERAQLLWKLRKPLDSWIGQDVKKMNGNRLDAILEGPYHAAGDCYEDLRGMQDVGLEYEAVVIERCTQCRQLIEWEETRRARGYGSSSGPRSLHRAQRQVLLELQRLSRLGRTIEGWVTIFSRSDS